MEAFCYDRHMSLICISGHQGTGKSTILKELISLGQIAYGLDENKVAGYYDLAKDMPSVNIPQGLNRNLEWRKNNVWRVDMSKVHTLAVAKDNKPTFYLGYASNVEDLWDICDEIIILQLNDETTVERLWYRTDNSFGKHPGELQLAIENSKKIYIKAESYSKHPVHFIDASLDIQSIVLEIIRISDKSPKLVH